jgi:hypothetical protein
MATKKAAKKASARTAAGKDYINIGSPEFHKSIDRLTEAMKLIVRARTFDPDAADLRAVREAISPHLPPSSPSTSAPAKPIGVEGLIINLRELTSDIAKQAEHIRVNLYNGPSAVKAEGTAGQAPTQGPIKDALEYTTAMLYSIRRDLDAISQYLDS